MQRSRALRRRQSRASTARRLPLRTLRVSTVLAYTDPPIWRRLELASDLRLDELHRVLQAAFDWEGGHLHQFSAENRTWDDGSAADFGPGPFSTSPSPEPERTIAPVVTVRREVRTETGSQRSGNVVTVPALQGRRVPIRRISGAMARPRPGRDAE